MLIVLAPPAASRAENSTQRAVGWLTRAQNDDGGYGSAPDLPSNAAMTGWVMLALEAAGVSPAKGEPGRPSPLAYLRAHSDRIRTIGDLERTMLALEGASVDAHSFAGRDLVAELRRRRSADGSFADDVNLTAYGILALDGAGGQAPRASIEWLKGAQSEGGGWGFTPGAVSEADSTGAVLEALGAAGARGAAMRDGIRYLHRSQHPSGGWSCAACPGPNAQSTALAVQGLIASGVQPESVRNGGRSGLDYLRTRQTSEGWFRYSAESDQSAIWTTARAVPAVEGQALPLEPIVRPRLPAKGKRRTREPLQESAPSGHIDKDRPDAARAGDPSRDHNGRASRSHPPADSREPSISAAPRLASAGSREGLVDPSPATRPEPSGSTAPWVIAGFGALSASLIFGFLWYRRRLP